MASPSAQRYRRSRTKQRGLRKLEKRRSQFFKHEHTENRRQAA